MIMQVEINSFDELMEHSWSGALDNLRMIDKYDLGEEFMSYLEEMFYDSTPTDTEVNDAIWFMEQPTVEEWIAERKDISDVEDLDELLDIAKDLCYTDTVSTIREAQATEKETILWDYCQSLSNLRELFDDLNDLDLEELEEE